MTIASENARIIAAQRPVSTCSPGGPRLSELQRIREAYARRRRTIPSWRYSSLDRAYVFQTGELKKSLIQMLTRRNVMPLAERRILDVGCGDARWLRALGEFGAQPQNFTGIDLLPERIAVARKLCSPLTTLQCGDASRLPFADSSFDILMSFTLFSSIHDPALKVSLAAEILRVLRPGGFVLWYDFRVNNPRNPDVRGISKREVEAQFPGTRVELERITLAPPLARLVAWSDPILKALSSVQFLRTHYFGSITK
ncbi:MAG: class I SAM-dependent methyltransferase [Candidatus Acidiferrales bacterium]|jgi:SAM-dependent methyltransferase